MIKNLNEHIIKSLVWFIIAGLITAVIALGSELNNIQGDYGEFKSNQKTVHRDIKTMFTEIRKDQKTDSAKLNQIIGILRP